MFLMRWIIIVGWQCLLWKLLLLVHSSVFCQDIEEANTVLMQRVILESHSDVALSLYPNIDLEHIRSVKVARTYMQSETLTNDVAAILGAAAWEQCWAAKRQPERNVLNYFYKMWKLSELADDVRVQTICSIGVDIGYSSLAFLESNPTARLIAFDTFDHAYAPVAVRRLQEMFPRRKISVLVGDSARSVPHIADLLRDSGVLCNLVYVDGGQSAETLLHDLKHVMRVVDPRYHRVIVDGLDDPERAGIWRELTTLTMSPTQPADDIGHGSSSSSPPHSHNNNDNNENVFTEVEIVASRKYDCISWDNSQGRNGEYIFSFHEGRCAISANSSLMGVGFFHPSLTASTPTATAAAAPSLSSSAAAATEEVDTTTDTCSRTSSSSCIANKKSQGQGLAQGQGQGLGPFRPEFVLYVVGENDKANDVRYNGGVVRSSESKVGISGTDSSAIITMEMIGN